MTIQQYLDLEVADWQKERAQRLRDCLKPRIKRQAGTWVCNGKGVIATGFSPAAAYGGWVVSQRQRQIMLASQAQPARQFFEGWPCFK